MSSQGSSIHSSLHEFSRTLIPCRPASACWLSSSGGPMTATVTSTPRRRSAEDRSIAYCHTPPTPSAVMRTWRTARAPLPAVHMLQFQVGERTWPGLLNVAELVELREVMLHRPLPGAIVGSAPAPGIARRPGVREHRHRRVRPYAELPKVGSPRLDLSGVVGTRLEEIRLHERHPSLGMDQAFGQLLGRKAAPLVEEVAPFDGDALDAGFDGDAAGPSEQVQHRCSPQIDACLNAKDDGPLGQALEQFPVRQKNLVDEIDVLDPLVGERVDFFQHHR